MKKFSGMKIATYIQKGTREHSESWNGKSRAKFKEQLIHFLKNSKRLQWYGTSQHTQEVTTRRLKKNKLQTPNAVWEEPENRPRDQYLKATCTSKDSGEMTQKNVAMVMN